MNNDLLDDIDNSPNIVYASFFKRFRAGAIDFFIIIFGAMIFVLVLMFMSYISFMENYVFSWIGAVALFTICCAYFSLWESSASQGTIGKQLLAIKVVDEEGERISLLRSMGRFFSKSVSCITFFVGFISILFTPKKRGLHDMMANVYVVEDDHSGSPKAKRLKIAEMETLEKEKVLIKEEKKLKDKNT